MITIQEFDYSKAEVARVMSYWTYATNWPIVYIMHNDTDAYVGETLDGIRRTKQHLEEQTDTEYKLICMMTDKNFNKSAALDMESFLIKYMVADGKFKLHNGNAGIVDHNYFNRDIYRDEFRFTWTKLIEKGLANQTIEQIENLDLFKYSPYKALTGEQEDALTEILCAIRDNKNLDTEKKLIVVNGEAGTGKTILAVYLVKILKEMANGGLAFYQEEDAIDKLAFLKDFALKIGQMKIGFVVPMQSLRESLKKVFNSVDGLSPSMILKPTEVIGGNYDLLIVDEAHRLHRRAYLSQYPVFDETNKKLGLDQSGTEFDWIFKSSRMQLIFYDREQSVRPSDIQMGQFKKMISDHLCREIELKSQLRCKGGKDYIDYVKAVIYEKADNRREKFNDYEVKLFDDPNEMIKAVRLKDNDIGLCRVVAGYGWKWNSNKNKNAYDITLNGMQYRWNSVPTDWVNSPNAINEIGCIHTVQGYDLNIAGVIFGPEIRYDQSLKTITIDKSNYYDNLGKTKDMDELKGFIQNIYVTLMTRGIRGTYIYACDPGLQDYLRKYF
jgi:DUF2075 family protein/predicted GIY-YIG superfamily endonuclease